MHCHVPQKIKNIIKVITNKLRTNVALKRDAKPITLIMIKNPRKGMYKHAHISHYVIT